MLEKLYDAAPSATETLARLADRDRLRQRGENLERRLDGARGDIDTVGEAGQQPGAHRVGERCRGEAELGQLGRLRGCERSLTQPLQQDVESRHLYGGRPGRANPAIDADSVRKLRDEC